MMFANHRVRIVLYAIAILAVVVPRVCADEVSLVNEEEIRFLAEGMEAARESVVDVRAELSSVTVIERPGSHRTEIMTKTGWVSKGGRFKYETNLSQLFDGKPPQKTTGPGPIPVANRVCQRAFSGEVLMSYFPERKKAIIRPPEVSPAATLIDRAQQEPLFYGLSLLGLSLGDIVAGKSWRYRPEDKGLAAERVVKWSGTLIYDGREVQAVEVAVRYTKPDGTPMARYYEIFVDPARGFTVPFISVEFETAGVREKAETVETECIEYGDGIWGPQKTVHTRFFQTEKGPGKGVTTTTIDRLELNTGVTEDELLISLPGGTEVDDQISGVYYEYIAGGESAILDELIKSLSEAGFSTPPPLAAQTTPPGEPETVTILPPAEIPANGAGGFPVSALILLLVGAGVLACLIVVFLLRRRRTKTAGD